MKVNEITRTACVIGALAVMVAAPALCSHRQPGPSPWIEGRLEPIDGVMDRGANGTLWTTGRIGVELTLHDFEETDAAPVLTVDGDVVDSFDEIDLELGQHRLAAVARNARWSETIERVAAPRCEADLAVEMLEPLTVRVRVREPQWFDEIVEGVSVLVSWPNGPAVRYRTASVTWDLCDMIVELQTTDPLPRPLEEATSFFASGDVRAGGETIPFVTSEADLTTALDPPVDMECPGIGQLLEPEWRATWHTLRRTDCDPGDSDIPILGTAHTSMEADGAGLEVEAEAALHAYFASPGEAIWSLLGYDVSTSGAVAATGVFNVFIHYPMGWTEECTDCVIDVSMTPTFHLRAEVDPIASLRGAGLIRSTLEVEPPRVATAHAEVAIGGDGERWVSQSGFSVPVQPRAPAPVEMQPTDFAHPVVNDCAARITTLVTAEASAVAYPSAAAFHNHFSYAAMVIDGSSVGLWVEPDSGGCARCDGYRFYVLPYGFVTPSVQTCDYP